MLVSEIIRAISPIESSIQNDVPVSGAVLDSRLAVNGAVFFATKGEQLDGNQFAKDALEHGASLIVMNDKAEYDKLCGNKALVDDSILSMQMLGRVRFANTKALKIAVTGSFGKTGTKEMLKLAFSPKYKVYATAGNKNNELGVTLTGAGIDDTADLIITELGTSSKGEIAALSDIVKPDIAIVTSVGHAHIGHFGDMQSIIGEKLSIVHGLKKGGDIIIPVELKKYLGGNDYNLTTFGGAAADIEVKNLMHHSSHFKFNIKDDDTEYRINHPYSHLARNAAISIAVAKMRGVPEQDIAQALLKYIPINKHGNIIYEDGLTIIDDTYNAGFESITKAIDSLAMINITPKYAVIGEMGEIDGYELDMYKYISGLAAKYKDINFRLCGGMYAFSEALPNKQVYKNKEELISSGLSDISGGVVLVKASRSKRFEDIVGYLRNLRQGSI